MNATSRAVEATFINALSATPDPSIRTIRSPEICLEDFRQDWQVENVLRILRGLKDLKGRTVDSIVWKNELSKDVNPMGMLGHFEITLKP